LAQQLLGYRAVDAGMVLSPGGIITVLLIASLPFLFLAINQMAFRDLPPEKTNNASALINLARNFGGSIEVAVTSTMLTRRAQFHQSRLIEQLQGLNPNYPDFAQQMAHTYGTTPDSSLTLASIYQTALQQANLLSYLDDFKLLAVVFLALLPLLLLVKPGKGGGTARGSLRPAAARPNRLRLLRKAPDACRRPARSVGASGSAPRILCL